VRALPALAILAAAVLLPAAARSATPESATPLRLGTSQFLVSEWQPGPLLSPLALDGATVSGFGEHEEKKDKDGKPKKSKKPKEPRPEGMPLGPERARILLQSLTIPGWGQETLGLHRSAAMFAFADLAIWASFASFRVQEQMRRESYRHTAMLGAGIDIRGRDEEFRRIVGAFISSDEYNLLVVSRDAANLYLQDLSNPDMEGYRAYIERYSLSGSDAWNWADVADFQRYGAQRKDAQRAAIRANNMLGLAIANRIISALHAARAAGRATPKPAHAWRFEFEPAPGDDATAFRAALRTSF
jgi:hypothetical protein